MRTGQAQSLWELPGTFFGKRLCWRRKAARLEARSKDMWWENSSAPVSGDRRSWLEKRARPAAEAGDREPSGQSEKTFRKCTCASTHLLPGGATVSASQPLASPAVVLLCTGQLAAAACDLGAGGGGGYSLSPRRKNWLETLASPIFCLYCL